MEGVSGFSGLTMTVLAYAAIWVILLFLWFAHFSCLVA